MVRIARYLAVLASGIGVFSSLAIAEENDGEAPPTFLSRLGRDTGRGVFFSTFDASERDRFIGWGFKYAPRGRLDEQGWRFMTTTGVKLRDVDAVSGTRYNRVDVARALLGYEWRLERVSVTALVGGSFALHSPDTANVLGRRGRVGPVAALEFWHNWGEQSAYHSRSSSGTLIADYAARSIYVKARHGFAVPGFTAQFGPEASFSSGMTIRTRGMIVQSAWQKYRLGLHLSEVPLWRVRLGISAGAELRRGGKSSAYASISSYFRY